MKNAKAVPIPDGNGPKYFSYREAWGRINKAQAYGFYLEAVTLHESIIADRLISFLVYAGAITDAKLEKYTFRTCPLRTCLFLAGSRISGRARGRVVG